MTEQTWWAVAIGATILGALIGFFVGRQSAGDKKKLGELESELARQQEALDGYKKEVESHFDRTATLFVSMAGSYKDLFEHLSSGYEKLSAGSARDLFKERFASVLLDGSAASRMIAGEEATAAADEAAEVAPPKPVENEDAGREAPAADEAAPSGEESAPDAAAAPKATAEDSAADAAKPPAGEPAMAPEDDTRKRAEAPETAEGAEEAAAGAEAVAEKTK